MKANVLFFVALTIVGCSSRTTSDETKFSNNDITKVCDIPLPDGYEREAIDDTASYAYFLRNLPLKPIGSPVYFYDSTECKAITNTYAVIDGIYTGGSEWEFSATAPVCLESEWLFNTKRYEELVFRLPNGDLCDYNRVEKGEMFTYKDGGLHWYEDRSTKPVYTHESFRAFLNLMFMDGIYFNSAHIALSKETENVKLSDLRIGDVFVRDGDYAVIVLDIATSANGKEKCFIVAEGIMPIRDIYILKNRVATETNESPWHYVSEINNSSGGYTIGRPDYNFVTIERLK